jgi:hypothetical protein
MCTSLRKDEHDPQRRPGLLASCGRAVAGVRAEVLGTDGAAFVVARPGERVDQDEIKKTVREQKGAHQTPKTIHVVDEPPKTAAGKIDKKALRRPYWGNGARQIHIPERWPADHGADSKVSFTSGGHAVTPPRRRPHDRAE